MSPQRLIKKFKQRGYKMTPQRRAILTIITDMHSHPTAEEIHEQVLQQMPDMSLATVYNTLHELVAIGEARELSLDCGVRRYELAGEDHAHLVCIGCGRIQNLSGDWQRLPSLFSLEDDFYPTRYEVTVHGYCADCVAAGEMSAEQTEED